MSPIFIGLTALALLASGNANALTENLQPLPTEVNASGPKAFSLPTANMPLLEKLDFNVGNSFFRNPWVAAPSSTTARDGLGPLFNTNGCQNCHIRDGRGHAPVANDLNNVSMLVRLSIPALTTAQRRQIKHTGVIPEPRYGTQLQDFATPGVLPEGRIVITYTEHTVAFTDGEKVSLRRPTLSVHDLAYGPLHPQTQMSARIAPPMIGLGLLAAIPPERLQSIVDIQARSNTGISGKINRVWNTETASSDLGRFGWKAGQPTLKQQNAAAFLGDLGITSSLFKDENCTTVQPQCQQMPSGGKPELSDNILRLVTLYTHNLGVPVRRDANSSQVKQGEALFHEARCHQCHVPEHKTGASPFPWLSHQTIRPYTDLLLHDMGEGLADNRPEFLATGTEWRTPPLWGIGLTKAVSGHESYLHDGRARNLMEAILWHGGEAQTSVETVLRYGPEQRQALIAFLSSL